MDAGIKNNNDMISNLRNEVTQLNNNFNNIAIAAYGSSGNPIDPNITQEHLVLTNINIPTSGYYYILTFFYQNKTGNRSQIAIPYTQTTKIYFRTCFDNSWSNWQ